MKQTFLTSLFVLLLAATGFVWFYYWREPVAPGLTGGSVPELVRYRELKSLAPDLGLFDEPAFQALRPISSPPGAPPAPGLRQNPFAQ